MNEALEIFWDDLTQTAKSRLLAQGLETDELDGVSPLAIIDEEEFLDELED